MLRRIVQLGLFVLRAVLAAFLHELSVLLVARLAGVFVQEVSQ